MEGLLGFGWSLGYSLGGTVAAWLAARKPHRVTALVLLAPGLGLAARLRSLAAATHPGYPGV